MTTPNDLYAMYLRKSRADLELEAMGEGETLARHKATLLALADKHDIHPNQIIIYEEIVSGESIQDRPKMQQLLNDVYSKKYKGVLVMEVERLARGNTKDQGEVSDAFQFSKTLIITPSKTYDPNNEFDEEYFEFGLFMSRREYKTIRRRMMAGKYASVSEGNYIGAKRIFGYQIQRLSKKDRILVPDPEEAKIVQMVFDWSSEENMGSQQIANKLNEMGIKPLVSSEWARSSVTNMLKNEHYIGKIRWFHQGNKKEFNPKTGKLERRYGLTPDKVVLFPGKHKAIISEEQFYKVQKLMSERFVPPVKQEYDLRNHYAGFVKCCDCGKTLRYKTYKGMPPVLKHPASSMCKKKIVYIHQIDEALITGLKGYIGDFEFLLRNDNNQGELLRHQEMIDLMEKELAKQEKNRKRLFDDYDDDVYTKEEFVERKQIYNQTIEALKEKIEEAKTNLPKPINYEDTILHLHQMIDCISDPDISAEDKNNFLKQFIECIKVDVIDHGHMNGATPILDIELK